MFSRAGVASFLWLVAGACGDDGAAPTDGGRPDTDADLADADELVDAAPPDAGPPPLPDLIYPSGVLDDTNPDPSIVEVSIVADETTIDLGDGTMLDAYAYNGLVPGPALRVRAGDRVIVHFTNRMDAVETTIHWHGFRIPDEMDGSQLIQDPVAPAGGTFTYDFVVPEGATFWFHPHMSVHEVLDRGLYAPAPIVDPLDPAYDAERMLILDDILVAADGTPLPRLATDDERLYGRYGNLFLTNGRLSDGARATVREGRVERWRVLNAANARTMRLSVTGASARVIASEGGLLQTPFAMPPELLVGSGQRYDLEVSYDTAGTAALHTRAVDRQPDGSTMTRDVVMFAATVEPTGEAPRAIPWPAVPPLVVPEPTRAEDFRLDALRMMDGTIEWRVNGLAHHHDPIFTFTEGDVVQFRFQNLSLAEHPFHLHGQFFTIVRAGTTTPSQPGHKDTALVAVGETEEVIASLDNPGTWMIHCHILEHAELGMMAQIEVAERP
jgi:FtsP/CotA-like multicopper oxidase with cupredoxin domain